MSDRRTSADLEPSAVAPREWGVCAMDLGGMATNCTEASQWQVKFRGITDTSPNFPYPSTCFFNNPIIDESYTEPEKNKRILAVSIFLKYILFYDIL